MSVWDKLSELKDSLEETVQQQQDHSAQPIPAGHHKNQGEARAEIHGEIKHAEEIQAKEGWSQKVR